jgi:tetratricopeptide (TPR) repeat protein
VRAGTTTLLIFALYSGVAAENVEKAQKKELESQAKAMVFEARSLEQSGRLAEARAKYAESQAMMETNEAANGIKHLDDEIRGRTKEAISNARKLYDSHKYKEAEATLEEGVKFGTFESAISYDLALCYYQLGNHDKAVEFLDRAITATSDSKQKQKLSQLLTFFSTGESGTSVKDSNNDQISKIDLLIDSIALETSLQDERGEDHEELFSDAETPSAPLVATVALKTSSAPGAAHASVGNKTSLCSALDSAGNLLASSPSATFDRATCAEINGHLAEAVRLLQHYLELAPNALDTSQVRTRIANLQSLLALPDPSGTEIRRSYAAAYGYLAKRKYDHALAAFSKANELAPDFGLNQWKLALLYEAIGDIARAREAFARYQQLTSDQSAKDDASLHLTTLAVKKSKYDEEVDSAEDILADLFNRGMNLSFNLDESRSAIHAKRARIKKKQDRKKDQNRVGGFAVPYPYAQQQLAEASEHLQVALALFPFGAEANELMGLLFLQANDGRAATRSFDAVASQGLPVAFYAEMRGHKLDHAVKCELTRDRLRLIFLSSYNKKGTPIPPEKPASGDGLGDITLASGDEHQAFDSLELSVSDIKRVETNRGLLTIKLAKQDFTLAPIYLPSFTPVEGPPARRFANNYTRLFIRYPGLEDSKLGAEGMTGKEKLALGYKLASQSMGIAASLNPFGAIQATQSAISIARTIHAAMASLSVGFSSWERSADDEQQLLSGPSFKSIPTEAASLVFVQEVK